MKKLLLLIALVVFGIPGAFAQAEWADTQDHDDVVTDISQLSNEKVYSVIPEDWYHPTQDGDYLRPNGLYGVLFARENGDRLLSAGGWGNCIDNQDPRKEPYAGWQTQDKAVQKDSYSPLQQFAFIQYEGKYYLWSVGAHKFASVHDMAYLGYTNAYAELSTSKVSPVVLQPCVDVDKYDNRYLVLFEDAEGAYRKLSFSVAWHSNASFQTEALLTPDMSEGDLSSFEICGRGTFDPSEAIEVLDNIFHPAATITYTVNDSEGNLIFTSEAIPVSTGVTIDDLPDNMKEDFYTYTCDEPVVTVKGDNFITLVKGERVYPVEYLEYAAPTELKKADWSYFTDTNPGLEYDISEGKPYYLTLQDKFLYVEENGVNAGKPSYDLKYSDVLEDGNEAYQWVFMADETIEGAFYIFNVSLGGLYRMDNMATIKLNRKNNIAPSSMSPCGKPYGTGFAIGQVVSSTYPVINDYIQISEEQEGAFQVTSGEGEEGKRQYPVDPKHTFRVYEVTDEPIEVDITYNVRTADGVTVASGVYPVPLGSLVEELDPELIRDFSDYEYPDPFVALPGGDNMFTARVTFTLPFTEGTPYRIMVDGKYLKADKETGAAVIDADATEEDTFDPVYFWGFRGNPYGGIEITNRGMGMALANNHETGDDIPVPFGDAEWWNVFDNGAGMAFGKDDKFIANVEGTLLLTSNEDLMWEEASGFNISEVETAEVHFVLKDAEGNEILTKTEGGHYVGVAVDDIPVSMKRPFCEYSTEPVMVTSEGAEVESVVTYNTPFTTDGEDYYLKVDDATMGYVNNALLAKVSPTDADKKDKAFFWTFTGTPYDGYTVKNTLSGKYLSGSTRVKTRLEMKDEPATFNIAAESEGFTFAGINGEYICREGNVVYIAVEPETESSKILTTEKVPSFISVTYIVEDESGTTVYTSQDEVIEGTVITDLPAAAKRDFCTYTENSITVEEGAENVFKVTVSYSLPFNISDFDDVNMQWYTLNTDDGQVLASYFDDFDSEYYVRTETPDAASQAQQWAFGGSPYEGFKLYNRERAQYLLADDNTDNYGVFADEGTLWTISGTAETMQLSSNGQNFYYFDDYGFCMLGDGTTTFSVEFVPQNATVIYNIVDENNDLVYTETDDNALIGSVIEDLPATAKREFCSYEFDPLTVAVGENTLTAKVTYDLPFDMNTYNYITVGDTAAVYGVFNASNGYGYAGFEDVRPVEGAFDIKDITTWYKWPYTLEQQGMIHDAYGDTYDAQYGYSLALSTDFLWTIEGDPYLGFTLAIFATDNDGNPQYLTDDDGYTDVDPVVWQLSSIENGYAFKTGEKYLSAYYYTYQGKQYGYIGSDSEPTAFNFVPWDFSVYSQLTQEYEDAQSELNAYITDIKTVTTNKEDAKRIYDLQGRRMNQVRKGVNIVNGKKVLVK